ncbi:hypothetical protein AB0C10_16100 [Microbispora amethystogenes]|uniref:glycine-rich domain-containing protein n=1 Tax=Microbispora amethystogenes TaxID=1427754 RepID=UPI0033DE0300
MITVQQEHPPAAGPRVPIPKEALVTGLVPQEVFDRLVAGLAADHAWDKPYATRVMTSALAYLVTCAFNPDLPLRPSEVVDLAWHEFYKRINRPEYTAFCDRLGRFIAHVPDAGPINEQARVADLGATVEAMREVGMPVDIELWLTPARCSQGYDDPADDPKAAHA